ncbi:MAG: acyl-ACP--UDP-N-acetylglucosamine O-acyltransferase [Myxococcales bacterium]|nr:acyl-ACP--UDP-N-acetylglucosamine O-acyltransferase [Myxococcales bacterium]
MDPGAEIAADARVHPTAMVGAGARVGAGCILHAYAIVGPHTTLGPRCVVHPFAVVGGPAQDRRTDPDAPFRLECGEDNVFREGVTVSRGTAHGGGLTRLGDGNLLMAQAHVGHDCRVGDGVTLANGVSLAGHVEVDDQVTFGGHAAVHQFARVGRLAFVAANAMVSRDVPPFCLAAGDRARLLGLNVTGLRRAGIDAAGRAALKAAYRALLLQPGRAEAAARLAAADDPNVAALAAFVAASPRGVTRAGRG